MIVRPAAVPDDAAPLALEEARRIVQVIDRRVRWELRRAVVRGAGVTIGVIAMIASATWLWQEVGGGGAATCGFAVGAHYLRRRSCTAARPRDLTRIRWLLGRGGAQAWLSERELWVVCDDDEEAVTVSADERAAARAALPAARVVGPRA